MDVASDIAACKRLLDELEAAERVETGDTLIKLENIYYHLPPQVAPRLQRDFDQCQARSHVILGALFDKVEISDKSLLNLLLRLFLAYGNFRLAQISYHIESARDETEPDVGHTPILTKSKWYDLSPLLPPITAETLDWKSILIHALVKDSDWPRLRVTCDELLVQKLHFYAIIAQLDRFRNQTDLIRRNGERVAEKIAQGVFDSANDDQEVITLNSFIFNLILPFTNIEQQSALIEAIVVARFKSHLPDELEERQEVSSKQLDKLISECLMNNANLQEVLFTKLIEQLKCSIIRRKRRHSVEASENGDQVATLEGLLAEITEGAGATTELLLKTTQVEVKSKTLQRTYLQHWVEFVKGILTKKTLTPKSSTIVLTACSVILVTCSKLIDNELNTKLALLLAKTIDTTTHRKLDKLFKVYHTNLLIDLTKLFAEQTALLDQFETPLMRFYKSYFGRHIRHCTLRHFQKDAEKFAAFPKFICDRTIGKNKSTILGYIYLCELSDFLESMKTKASNKSTDLYVDYGRSISKKLYSFLKNRPFTSKQNEHDDDELMEVSLTNGENGHTGEVPFSNQVQVIVIDALVCILKIAVDRKDQAILDTYGELMLKLYNLLSTRIEELIEETRLGNPCEHKPIDPHLHRLINLYATHRETIEPYICYDLNKNICEKLVLSKANDLEIESKAEDAHVRRKSTYADIKSKLEQLQERDEIVFQTIINKQYSSVVDQNLGQVSDVAREESCSKQYRGHMVILTDVLTTLLITCDYKTYVNVLQNVVRQFECCDALNHSRVLNLLHTLEALIPKADKDQAKANAFKMAFPTIGCCLIRMAKSVELGPSVLSFTNPGTHKSSGGIQCCTYSNCIRVYTLVFNRFPPTFTNSLITDAMQVSISANLIRYAKYSEKLHRFFIQLASSMANLLKAVSMGKRDLVEQGMPVFLSVLSLLIRCIILASDRKKLEELPSSQMNGHGGDEVASAKKPLKSNGEGLNEKQCKVYESQLEYLARDVGRLLNNLCFLETKLVDYAPQLISTYIKDTQRASCPEFVKKHLDEGIFRIFNLVDSYQKDRLEQVTDAGIQRKTTAGRASGSIFEMIHARLDQASREIFKDMHDHYNKFHRYLGKC